MSSFFQMHKNTKVVNTWEDEEDRYNGCSLRQALVSSCLGKNLSVCGDLSRSSSCNGDQDDFHKSVVTEPVKIPEDLTRFITMLVNELPEFRPGWPLLCRVASPDVLTNVPRSYSFRQIPVAQWVLKLPSRTNSLVSSSNAKQLSSLNNESLATVPGGNDSMTLNCSPEGLHQRFFSTSCRSFKYKELVSVTSNFSPGLFPLRTMFKTLCNMFFMS